MTKILVATDGSDRSGQAIPHAASLAQALSGELTLLRVLNPVADCSRNGDESLAAAVERVSAAWLEELQAQASMLRVRTTPLVAVKQTREDSAEAIVRESQEAGAGLVAMATRGTGFVRRALLGSIATRVLQQAPVPVMLMGSRTGPARGALPYRLLVTTDGSDASESVLPAVTTLTSDARAEDLSLHLLRVYEPARQEPAESSDEQAREELEDFARGMPQRFPLASEVVVDSEHAGVGDVIRDYAETIGADAICMSTHGHSWRKQVLLGSVAMTLVEQSPVPIILVRAGR